MALAQPDGYGNYHVTLSVSAKYGFSNCSNKSAATLGIFPYILHATNRMTLPFPMWKRPSFSSISTSSIRRNVNP